MEDETSKNDEVIFFRGLTVNNGTTVASIDGGEVGLISFTLVGEANVRLHALDVHVQTTSEESINTVSGLENTEDVEFTDFTFSDFEGDFFVELAPSEFVVVLGGDEATDVRGTGPARSEVEGHAAGVLAALALHAEEVASISATEDGGGVVESLSLGNRFRGTSPADPGGLAKAGLDVVNARGAADGHFGLTLSFFPDDGGVVSEAAREEGSLQNTLVGDASGAGLGGNFDGSSLHTSEEAADHLGELDGDFSGGISEHVTSDVKLEVAVAAASLFLRAEGEGLRHFTVDEVSEVGDLFDGDGEAVGLFVVRAVRVFLDFLTSDVVEEGEVGGVPSTAGNGEEALRGGGALEEGFGVGVRSFNGHYIYAEKKKVLNKINIFC